ncbi:MAG: class I SAM-dependent methyltransferase [Halanaerobium sp.]
MECKICGSSNLELLDIQNKYYHCHDCEVIFIDQAEIVNQAEEKNRYQGHDNNHQNEGYVRMFEDFIAEVIKPYINLDKIEEGLDFGCGPGPVLADLLESEGIEVDLYDPYFFPGKVFLNKKYDLITSTEVFEHFSNPIKEMELLTSHLGEGSYLAVMTSFHPGPDKFEDWWYKWDPTHIVFYNQKTFNQIASDFGLDIMYTDQEKYILFKA